MDGVYRTLKGGEREGGKGEKNRGVDCAERANSNPRSLHQIANRAALNRKLEIAAGARMTGAKCSAFGLYRYEGERGRRWMPPPRLTLCEFSLKNSTARGEKNGGWRDKHASELIRYV